MSNEKQTLQLAREQTGQAIQLTLPSAALARTISSSISSATSITLNAATALIEVTAEDQGIYLRYQAGVSSSNFDEYISAGTTRHYVIPNNVTVVSVIERAATASIIVIEK